MFTEEQIKELEYIAVASIAFVILFILFSIRISIRKRANNELVLLFNNTVSLLQEDEDEISSIMTPEKHLSEDTYNKANLLFSDIYTETSQCKICVMKFVHGKFLSFSYKEKENIACQIDNLYQFHFQLLTLKTKILEEIKEIAYRERLMGYQQQYEQEHHIINPLKTPLIKDPFFGDCTSMKQLTKKYRKLVKKYHPDSGGDAETFMKIQQLYEERKNAMS